MDKKRRSFSRWLYDKIPIFFRKNIFEWFSAFLCLSVSIPIWFTGLDSASIEHALPPYFVYVWNAVLTIGPILIILGLTLRHATVISDHHFWIRIEALGLGTLAYMGGLYATALWISVGRSALIAITLTLIFALTCFVRMCEAFVEAEEFLENMGVQKNAKPD